jgi:hypothetical protein
MTTEQKVQHIKGLILRGEREFNGTALPSGQTTGTFTQRCTYAEMKARQIVEQGI